MKKRYTASLLVGLCSITFGYSAEGGESSLIGKTVQTVNITDANDKPKEIPFLGQYVVTLFYTDPDVKDVNEALSSALKERNFPKDKYKGVGVANCDDTWLPNAAIRMATRQKQEKYPEAVILLDQEKKVAKEWGLQDCNEAGVVIIIGKDKKIKFIKAVKTAEESKSISSKVIKIIEQEIAK